MSQIDRLTFLTFNAGLLQFKCLGFSWYENPPFTNRRLKHIPSKARYTATRSCSVALRASEADIICMQEVFDVTHAEFLKSALSMIYPYHGRRSSGKLMAIDNGLLVLSKFPIISSTYHPFEKITWSESMFGSKGILSCLIEVPSIGILNVLNVHMVSGTVDPESRSLDDIRLREMSQVLQLAQASARNGQSPMIIGDFNAGPTVCPSCYNHLIGLGWQDAYVAGRVRQGAALPSSADIISHRQPRRYRANHCIRSVSAGSGTIPSANIPCNHTKAESLNDLQPKRKEINVGATTTTAGTCSFEISSGTSPKSGINSENTQPLGWSHKLSHTRDSMARLLERINLTGNALNVEGDDGLGWTWDPSNPLNVLGPHSGCHGLRCDHLFLPPPELNIALKDFACSCSLIIFDQPRVLVYSRWLKNCLCAPFYKCFNGGFGRKTTDNNRAPLLVTLSDHHAVKVILDRCV